MALFNSCCEEGSAQEQRGNGSKSRWEEQIGGTGWYFKAAREEIRGDSSSSVSQRRNIRCSGAGQLTSKVPTWEPSAHPVIHGLGH